MIGRSKWSFAAGLCVAVGLLAQPAAADVVRIGNVLSLTGAGATLGQHILQAEELYIKLHQKDLPPGTTIQLITRDDGSKADNTRRLAQELVVRDKVQMIAGIVLSPEGFSVAQVGTEAKVPVVIMNATTGSITRASPYIVRFSHSNWQMAHTLGEWAAQNGFKRSYVMVADYAAGLDMQAAFTAGFTGKGGQIVGADHTPLNTTDYLPYMDRVKAAKPDSLFVFQVAGSGTVAMWKAYGEAGLKAMGVVALGSGDVVPETELKQTGPAAEGMISASIYTASLKTPANQEFLAEFRKAYGKDTEVSFESVGAWNGMAAIFQVVRKLGVKATGDAAMELFKHMRIDGPSGEISIDPQTRDIVQPVYLGRIQKVGDSYENVPFATIPAVKDAWKILNPQ